MKCVSNQRLRHRRRGFTLVEMILSATIIAILMLGMQSAMLLASCGSPERATASKGALSSARAIDRLSADLTYANTINTLTANTVEFVVPDRTGDNSPETIRYSWSGISGDPLLRTVNNGTAATVASNVMEFSLTSDKRSKQQSTSYTESGEVLLCSNDGISLLNAGNFTVDANDFIGEYFKPTLPIGTTQWRVTRVKIMARQHSGNTGQTRVQIRNASGTTPTTVIDEGMMYESNLTSSYQWQEFDFTKASGLSPSAGLCLVLQWNADSQACDVQYQSLLSLDLIGTLVKSTNGGSSWSAPLSQDMIYYVYGTYSTTNPISFNYWLTDVRVTLRTGSDTQGRVRTTIRTIDEPQVSGP